MRIKEKYDPYDINPSMIAIDEADLLLNEKNIRKSTYRIL